MNNDCPQQRRRPTCSIDPSTPRPPQTPEPPSSPRPGLFSTAPPHTSKDLPKQPKRTTARTSVPITRFSGASAAPDGTKRMQDTTPPRVTTGSCARQPSSSPDRMLGLGARIDQRVVVSWPAGVDRMCALTLGLWVMPSLKSNMEDAVGRWVERFTVERPKPYQALQDAFKTRNIKNREG
ncbi:hypothetical protein PSPO01_06069 [Paraphaeosphaeria sporulosa]